MFTPALWIGINMPYLTQLLISHRGHRGHRVLFFTLRDLRTKTFTIYINSNVFVSLWPLCPLWLNKLLRISPGIIPSNRLRNYWKILAPFKFWMEININTARFREISNLSVCDSYLLSNPNCHFPFIFWGRLGWGTKPSSYFIQTSE